MLLRIKNEWLINSKSLLETEKVLSGWMDQHPGEVIYAYQLDGETHYDDWVSFLNMRIESDNEVNLISKPEADLKKEMKDSVLEYCRSLREELPIVIENLFGTHPETEEKKLAALFEGLEYLISSGSLLNLDESLKDRHESVVELAQAYESKDFVELADLLKYDWLPWVHQFEGSLQKLHVGM